MLNNFLTESSSKILLLLLFCILMSFTNLSQVPVEQDSIKLEFFEAEKETVDTAREKAVVHRIRFSPIMCVFVQLCTCFALVHCCEKTFIRLDIYIMFRSKCCLSIFRLYLPSLYQKHIRVLQTKTSKKIFVDKNRPSDNKVYYATPYNYLSG